MDRTRVALICGVVAAIFLLAPGPEPRRQFQPQPIQRYSIQSSRSVPLAWSGEEGVYVAPQSVVSDQTSMRLLALAGGAVCAAAMSKMLQPAALAVETKVDAKAVKKLRDATGAGMMDCKKALVDANGNEEEAAEALRNKGLAAADKKASRKASEGVIEAYIHTGSKLGVMVELNCETDFVAKTPEFKQIARTIAMQVAASPTVEMVSAADVPPDFVENEKRIESQAEDLQGKPPEIVDKIVTGRVDKLVKTKLLLPQPFIRDPTQTVEDFVKSSTAKLGENIQIARFHRFTLGGSKKPESEESEE